MAGESTLDGLGGPDEIASTLLNQDFLEDISSPGNEEWYVGLIRLWALVAKERNYKNKRNLLFLKLIGDN